MPWLGGLRRAANPRNERVDGKMSQDRSRTRLWSIAALAGAGIAALLLMQGVQPAAWAEAPPAAAKMVVPDLLDLPAAASTRATNALQLALARAGDRLVSVGENGIVLLSDDNGQSWRQATSVPVSVTLTDVTFADAQQGWAVGHSGAILHSGDGGETWQLELDGNGAAQKVADEAAALTAHGAPNADAATRNGQYMISDGPDKPFLAVHFADANRGWVVGAYGLALMTVDGGKTWSSITARIPNPGGRHLYRIEEVGTQLVIAGEQGALFRSRDGGATFEKIESPYEGTFFGIIGLKDGSVLAYGLKGNAWRAGADMAQWQRIDLGQPVTVTAGAHLADGSIVLGDEGGRLLRSADNGLSFTHAGTPGSAGLTGVAQAEDGALAISGTRGNVRVAASSLAVETR